MSYKEEQAQKRLEYYQGMSGTMEKPSAMASREEMDAYAAQEVEAGNLPSSALPEAYGGRPTGTTRRAIRMQAEWDKQQKAEIEQQAALQAMDIQQKQFEMGQRDQQMQENDFYYNRGIKEAEQKMDAAELLQATTIVNAVTGLDPSSPDYLSNVSVILANNPLGADNAGVQKVLERYDKASARYEASQKSINEAQAEDAEEQAKLQADMVTYGVTPEQRREMLEPNLPAGVVRYNVNAAQPVIAAAKLRQEEEKASTQKEKERNKENTNLLRDSIKATAAFDALTKEQFDSIDSSPNLSDREKKKKKDSFLLSNPEAAKAFAAARAAAAVVADALNLPTIQSREDLKNYSKGDKVLAPDGITVITVR
jgi:hypothetical protein